MPGTARLAHHHAPAPPPTIITPLSSIGSVTGPISEKVAARLDGVYVKRDGFYNDRANDTTINDRDRFFGRAQLLFEPTDDISFRLIGDYTKRDESCCAATYVSPTMNEAIGNLVNPVASVNAGVAAGSNGNNIINEIGRAHV